VKTIRNPPSEIRNGNGFLVVHPGITNEEFEEMKPDMRHKLAQLRFDESSQWESSDIDAQAARPR